MRTITFGSLNPMLKRMSVALFFAMSLGVAAMAADPAESPALYNVEIVIFRAMTPLGVAEDWSTEAKQEQASAGAEPASEPEETAPARGERLSFQTLSSSQFKLAGTDAALRRSSNYEVLAHVGWSQAATPRGASSGVDLASVGVTDRALRGQAVLEQGRYLYLNLDLTWTPQDPPSSLLGTTDGRPVTFALKQKRRLRPFEQHYFDHPAFGVITIVTPVK
jgi:hypothetical protein